MSAGNQRPEWTQENARTFAAFMDTPTGRTWAERLRHSEIETNRRAVRNQGNTEYHAGYAAGYGDCIASIFLNSANVPPPTDESRGESDGVNSALERNTP